MKSTREAANAHREELLDAAEDIFHEVGYSGARLADIAERVGMTKGAIYGHFSSKADLYRAIFFERTKEEAHQEILDCYYKGGGVYDTLNRLIDVIYDDDYEILMGVHKRATAYHVLLAERPEELKEVVERFLESWELLLENHTEMLEQGKTQGFVRSEIDSYTVARLFYTTLIGHMLWFPIWFGHDPEAKQFRAMLRIQLVESLRP